MNQEEYMNRIFKTQVAKSTFLICLQYQPQLFQYIMPQMHCEDNYLLNTVHASVQERSIFNKQEQQQNLDIQRQSQVLQEPLCIKNETERDIYQTKFNGHWTQQEHELYLEFIKNHFDILKSQYDKKSKKIFKMMSQFIPTRTATQCRSHHQKFNPLQQIKRKKKSK